jgi:hypothetical protein
MPKDEFVYVGHMLDVVRLAAAKVHGVARNSMTRMRTFAWLWLI